MCILLSISLKNSPAVGQDKFVCLRQAKKHAFCYQFLKQFAYGGPKLMLLPFFYEIIRIQWTKNMHFTISRCPNVHMLRIALLSQNACCTALFNLSFCTGSQTPRQRA